MESLLASFEAWLRANHPATYAALRPGLSARGLNTLARDLGVELPDPFRELYSWRNGQSNDTSLAGYSLMSASQIRRERATLIEILEEIEDDPNEQSTWWHPGWIPFLENGGGDYLCVDCMGTFGGPVGQVIDFSHEDGGCIVYPGLVEWLDTLLASFTAVKWNVTEHYWEPVDDRELWDFQHSRNPGYPIELPRCNKS